jgi:serine O-acetyltransferase
MIVERLWQLSCKLHRQGMRRSARLIKAINFVVFHCVLPPEAVLGRGVTLGHFGLGIVVHANTTLGDHVHLWHHVTLAVTAAVGSPARLTIEQNVVIGAGTVVVTPRDTSLRIGAFSVIGANSVVTHDVPSNVVVMGAPARVIREIPPRLGR